MSELKFPREDSNRQKGRILEKLQHNVVAESGVRKMETISWSDFEKVELRVGTILEVFDFPKAKKPACQLKIDFGEFGILNSSAQITTHYSKEALIGKQVLAVVNFPKKQIANFFSECLTTGVPDENGAVVLLSPDIRVANGVKLF